MIAAIDPGEVADLLFHMTREERAELDALIEADRRAWRPLPGPQMMAWESKADVIGFGGAAGGGKTDLACGLATQRHEKSMILRRESTQLTGIIDRLTELLRGRDGYNGAEKIWRLPRRQIEFGSVPNAGDETKFQGRPHDLLVFDEATNFLMQQVRFLLGWLRTTTPDLHCQALLTFNPPTTSEGRWVIEFFAPWLDPKHPNPAAPGELRWFATVAGKDLEVPDNRPFVIVKGERVYEFDAKQHAPQDIVRPMSRTFIPSRISDNPYLMGTGYMTQLQSLPEPLRSQMLYGDFNAGVQDDPWQVVPTAWVEAAMARWNRPEILPEMLSMGVDVARGGADETVIARRHKPMWFDEPIALAGSQTPDGPTVAGQVIAARRDHSPVHVDVIGVGASPYDFLVQNGVQTEGVNVSISAMGTDRSGMLRFFNLRSQLWWMFRELLDPANNTGAALPPHPRLKADLTAPKWQLQGKMIRVEGREDIAKRIGRSPDYASAYVLAQLDTPKLSVLRAAGATAQVMAYDPLSQLEGFHNPGVGSYDPLSFMER